MNYYYCCTIIGHIYLGSNGYCVILIESHTFVYSNRTDGVAFLCKLAGANFRKYLRSLHITFRCNPRQWHTSMTLIDIKIQITYYMFLLQYRNMSKFKFITIFMLYFEVDYFKTYAFRRSNTFLVMFQLLDIYT